MNTTTRRIRSGRGLVPGRVRVGLWVVMMALAFRSDGAERADADARQPEARSLVSAVVQNQRTTGSRARAKLSIEPAQGPTRSLQVLIKGRLDGPTHETLIVVMWPREEKGRAWMIRRIDGGETSGFQFAPPNDVTPLTARELDSSLFDSDLSVDDFAESFWEWPDQQLVGEEKVGTTECWVVESRTTDPNVRHPRMRSWLSKDKPIALRVEKFDKVGAVQKRLTAGRVVRRDGGGWVVAEWMVETVATGSRTRVSGSRSDRDLTLPAAEFTPDGVRQLLESK